MNLSRFSLSSWQKKLTDVEENTSTDPQFLIIFRDLLQTFENLSFTPSQEHLFETYLNQVIEQFHSLSPFAPYHSLIEKNYQLGIDFFRFFVNQEQSRVVGKENVRACENILAKGENVILFSNHQTEPDPQIIDIALQSVDSNMGKEMIFVAGERVVIDPFTIPLSLGRNLICIYSKKHIDHPIEKRTQKLQHNQKTMQKLAELLSTGGKIIWLAPSGGRDRPDTKGKFQVAPFDSASIAMFMLLAKKAKTKTHFFPLSLKSYPILPPPDTIQKNLGEMRNLQKAPVQLHLGNEVDVDQIALGENSKIRREKICEYFFQTVKKNYQNL